MLNGKHILTGITGSIAAYKSILLVRLLVREGAEVRVLLTPRAREFVSTVTLSALSGNPVLSEFYSSEDGTWNSHIDLAGWADLFLVAPATATTLGKMAGGIADNLLIATYLSARCPVLLAPAMDLDMFGHPATQKNLELLATFGNIIIEPGTGDLASGMKGKGRMKEPEEILNILKEHLSTKKKSPVT